VQFYVPCYLIKWMRIGNNSFRNQSSKPSEEHTPRRLGCSNYGLIVSTLRLGALDKKEKHHRGNQNV
jgi:hypothetical protein